MVTLAPSRFVVLFDASVLYSIRTTNIALELAKSGIFQPHWSPDIHEEWTRAVLAKAPTSNPAAILKRRITMDSKFPDALVTGYADLIAGLRLPDPDDRHVLAAAIVAKADVIVTNNLSHFPADKLATFGIEAQSADQFLTHQVTLAPVVGVAAARAVRARLHNPTQTVSEFLAALTRANLPCLAMVLAEHADKI